MRQVSLRHSLGAKLFLLTAGLILLTVGVNAWQNARFLYHDMERFSDDATLNQANEAATTTAAIVESWIGQVALVMHTVQGTSAVERQTLLKKFLASSTELVAIHLVKDGGDKSLDFEMTPDGDEARFGEQDAAKVSTALRTATLKVVGDVASKANEDIVLRNLAPSLSLPILAVAMPFTFAGGEKIWAVLAVWQNRLSGILPSSKLVTTLIVSPAGNVISASDAEDLKRGGGAMARQLLPLVRKTETGNGFTVFRDEHGTSWLGAFAKVPRLGAIALVRRDNRALDEATVSVIKRTALWAWLFILVAVMASVMGASSLTKSLRSLTLATRRIAGGDFETQVASVGRDEVGVLASSIGEMKDKIKRLMVTEVEKARLSSEMETAKMVQTAFFPKSTALATALSVGADYRPASECGGDWWGLFPIGHGRELLCIADATGHGAPAALVTAMAYSATSVMADNVAKVGGDLGPGQLLTELNKLLWHALGGQLGMTFFAATIDTRTGSVAFANAGHNLPFLLPASAKGKAEQEKLRVLKLGGAPLGLIPDAVFPEHTLTLMPGDNLVLYTDGLIECCSAANKPWGKKAFRDELQRFLSQPEGTPQELVAKIFDSAFKHFGSVPLADDVTLVAVQWQPPRLAAVG